MGTPARPRFKTKIGRAGVPILQTKPQPKIALHKDELSGLVDRGLVVARRSARGGGGDTVGGRHLGRMVCGGDVAALMEARLTTVEGVEVLDRAEIDRVLAEQRLSLQGASPPGRPCVRGGCSSAICWL